MPAELVGGELVSDAGLAFDQGGAGEPVSGFLERVTVMALDPHEFDFAVAEAHADPPVWTSMINCLVL